MRYLKQNSPWNKNVQVSIIKLDSRFAQFNYLVFPEYLISFNSECKPINVDGMSTSLETIKKTVFITLNDNFFEFNVIPHV